MKSFCFEKGAEKDLDKAIFYYKKAIEMGNSIAMLNLIFLYKNQFNQNSPPNKSYLLQLLQKSADLKNPSALKNLALKYTKGEDVEKDNDQAAFYYFQDLKANLCLFKDLLETEKVGRFFLFFLCKISLSLKKSKAWKPEYHPYFIKNTLLDSQIILLFLISKNRFSFTSCKFLIKGILFLIIFHLCNFQQILIPKDSPSDYIDY